MQRKSPVGGLAFDAADACRMSRTVLKPGSARGVEERRFGYAVAVVA